MKILFPLIAVLALFFVAYLGTEVLGLRMVFGTILPYVAMLILVCGVVYRLLSWARVPVPFRIPTTCGQQRSLTWIEQDRLENPHTGLETFGRMLLEVLFFRSLLRNTKTEVREGGDIVHGTDKWLWAGSLLFHWCFLVVLLRHVRFFTDPVPAVISVVADLDGFLQIGVPAVTLTGVGLLIGVTYLFFRRLANAQVRYISLPSDYFPLFLILGIAITGILLRHFVRADIAGVKETIMGVVTFSWASTAAEGVHWLFFVHLFFVCVLMIYFPFSKLMHLGGVFLSPTRNLANNNRAIRHINPWNYPVKTHPYEEYEDEFREKMKNVGIPVEKE